MTDKKLRRSRRLSFFQQGEDVYLHHDLTGDIMRLAPVLVGFIDWFRTPHTADEAHAEFDAKFTAHDVEQFLSILPDHRCLVFEDEEEEASLDGWVPVRGPWSLVYAPSTGEVEIGYVDRRSDEVVIERLGLIEARALMLADGEKTLGDIAKEMEKEFGDTPDLARKVRAAIFRLTHADRQVMKMSPEPMSVYDEKPQPPYLGSTMPFKPLGSASEEVGDVASTRDYHRSKIVNADDQFDVRETTLSHAFREPHAALGGKTYGGRIARVAIDRDMLRDDGAREPLRVLEVGGGTGMFAAAFLDGLAVAAPRLYNRTRYTILDIAPALQESQRARTAAHRVRLLRGDAVRLPIASDSIDLLIANEMIADLETAQTNRDEAARPDAKGPAVEAIRRFKLPIDDAPHVFWVNTGACAFMAEIRRVLKPGGRAIVTEFGERDGYPRESTHLDHREFSIHFGHVRAAAAAVGLEARVEDVPDVIELDGDVPVLATNRSFFVVLRALFAREGLELKKMAYTMDAMAELAKGKLEADRIQGMRFQPCSERVLGLRPHEFKALLITRPLAEGVARPRRVQLDL